MNEIKQKVEELEDGTYDAKIILQQLLKDEGGNMIEVGKIWKDIKGYEEYYQISNYGNVKSKERYSGCCYGKQRLLKEKNVYPLPDKTDI